MFTLEKCTGLLYFQSSRDKIYSTHLSLSFEKTALTQRSNFETCDNFKLILKTGSCIRSSSQAPI